MKYTLFWSPAARREMRKLDGSVQRRINAWMNKNIDGSDNPRRIGKGLTENLAGKWRYRIGDYRVVCVIEDNVCTVVAVSVGHRSVVYDI